MLSPPQNMKPYLGLYARIVRAYSLLCVLLCFLRYLALQENICACFSNGPVFLTHEQGPRALGPVSECAGVDWKLAHLWGIPFGT